MDPRDEDDRKRLFRHIETSYRRLEPFRKFRRMAMRAYAGPHYGSPDSSSEDARHRDIINMLGQAADVITMSLAANRPQVLVSVSDPTMEWFASHFQVAVNNLLKEIDIESTIRTAVLDAFFCMGVVKIYLIDSPMVELEDGSLVDAGKPFAAPVSLDNFVFDVAQTSWDKVTFAGDQYRISFDKLKDEEFYDQEVVEELEPTSKYGRYNEDNVSSFSRGDDTDFDEHVKSIDLADVYLPNENLVVTWPVDGVKQMNLHGPPLRVAPWDGPERGPYHPLSLGQVPDNIIGKSPAMDLYEQHMHINSLAAKTTRQAERQKDLTVFEPGHGKDAERVRDSADGETVRVSRVDAVQQVRYGGADQGTQSYLMWLMQAFDRSSGNLAARGGLGPSADTLGQDKLIHARMNEQEAKLQTRIVGFIGKLTQDLGHMMWLDSSLEVPGSEQIPGTQVTVDRTWTPEMREGDFLDYHLDIDPYSLPYQSPSQRLQQLNQFVMQIYLPLLQLGQTQGMTIDLEELVNIQAELANLPRLKRIVKFEGKEAEDMYNRESSASVAPTERRYVRESVSGGPSPEAQDGIMAQILAGQSAPQVTNHQANSLG